MNPNMRNEKLRAVFEELGFTHVRSVISSGNILFESPNTDIPELEACIEAAWPKKLNFASTTIIRSLDELEELVANDPFSGYQHSPQTSLNVTFLKYRPAHQAPIEGRGFRVVRITGREIFSVVDTTASKTPNYMAKVEAAYGKEMTTRTWKTVERIIKTLSE